MAGRYDGADYNPYSPPPSAPTPPGAYSGGSHGSEGAADLPAPRVSDVDTPRVEAGGPGFSYSAETGVTQPPPGAWADMGPASIDAAMAKRRTDEANLTGVANMSYPGEHAAGRP